MDPQKLKELSYDLLIYVIDSAPEMGHRKRIHLSEMLQKAYDTEQAGNPSLPVLEQAVSYAEENCCSYLQEWVVRLKEALVPPPAPLKEWDGNGDMMTLADFRQCCESGCFIDGDGIGEASDGKHVLPKGVICPSDFLFEMPLPEGTTHIIWYNK